MGFHCVASCVWVGVGCLCVSHVMHADAVCVWLIWNDVSEISAGMHMVRRLVMIVSIRTQTAEGSVDVGAASIQTQPSGLSSSALSLSYINHLSRMDSALCMPCKCKISTHYILMPTLLDQVFPCTCNGAPEDVILWHIDLKPCMSVW